MVEKEKDVKEEYHMENEEDEKEEKKDEWTKWRTSIDAWLRRRNGGGKDVGGRALSEEKALDYKLRPWDHEHGRPSPLSQ